MCRDDGKRGNDHVYRWHWPDHPSYEYFLSLARLTRTGAESVLPHILFPPCYQRDFVYTPSSTHLDPHGTGARPLTEKLGPLSSGKELIVSIWNIDPSNDVPSQVPKNQLDAFYQLRLPNILPVQQYPSFLQTRMRSWLWRHLAISSNPCITSVHSPRREPATLTQASMLS